MSAASSGDMVPEEFRHHGHEVVDWIADYLATPERYPVLAQVQPGEVKSRLPAQHPDGPEAMDEILRDFEQIIVPGDRKSTRLNSSHANISYAVFCLKKKKTQ